MRFARRAWRVISLALVMTACASDGDGDSRAPSATTGAESTARSPTTAASTTSEVPATTAVPVETTAPPTTLGAVATLVIEAIAELPGRSIRAPFSDGTSIIALMSVSIPDGLSVDLLVRLDRAGQIIQEGPPELLEESNVTSIVEAAGRRFLFAQYHGPGGFGLFCGLREIDVTTLTLGPLLELVGDVDCTGYDQLAVDDVNPSLVWIMGRQSVNRVDTAVGTVTSFPLGPLDVERQTFVAIQVVGGNVYVGADVYFDTQTGQPMTAPDGSALSPVVFRLDTATGTNSLAPVASAYLRLVDGRLVVRANDGRAQVIDQTTLTSTDVDLREIVRRSADRREIRWYEEHDGDSLVLRVFQADPNTRATVAEGSLDTTFELLPRSLGGAQIGDDLLIFGTRAAFDPAINTTVLTTNVYRTTAQPPP